MIQITIGITSFPRWAAGREFYASGQRSVYAVAYYLYFRVTLGKE